MDSPPNEPPLTALGRALNEAEDLKKTVDHLTHVIDTERQTTHRFRFNMSGLAVILVLILVAVTFAANAANDAKGVGRRLDDCLLVSRDYDSCYQQLIRQNQSGAVRSLKFQYCALRIPVELRTEDVMDGCVLAAYPDIPNILTVLKGK